MSQHCLCGQRVPKTLAQRTHHCPHCGLRADRDIISAALAACVDVADPDDPAPRGSTTHLPTPYAMGWPLSKRGGLSQPAPATRRISLRVGQDRQPPPGGLC